MSVTASPPPLALLPAFVPLPVVYNSPSPSPLSTSSLAVLGPPTSPQTPSSSTGFFSRGRASSFHVSSSTLPHPNRHDDARSLPPLPPLPALPFVLPPTPSTSASDAPASPNHPYIKSCSVPHHSKLGGRWQYACRVVPEAKARAEGSVPMARKESLGRMEMAGSGAGGEREPHTVWRTWSEFVEFSARLSNAFPVVGPSSPTSTPSSPGTSTLPSSFYRQTPRLSRKLTLFVTRSTLLQRQDDLDLFVRRLFDMPDSVRKSALVLQFFKMRDEDAGIPSASPGSASMGGEVRELAPKPRTKRPTLGVKHSTPDLRKLMMSEDLEGAFDRAYIRQDGVKSPFVRPPLPHRAATLDVEDPRDSLSRSSTSSSVTVTAHPSPVPSPLTSPLCPDNKLLPEVKDVQVAPKALKKGGPLRHFRSLQDLRNHMSSSSTPSSPVPPTPPLPLPASFTMARAHTQPLPTPILTHRAPSSGPAVGSFLRQRSSSKSSTTSSFEDAGNSPTYPFAGNGSFAFGPSGRLDRVMEGTSRPRRPSMPRTTSIATKASAGHSPSPSASSVDSLTSSMRRSLSEKGYPSGRSSTDFSDFGSYNPETPPTPTMGETCGKYYLENGQLSQNNMVPPPPFFPVPPSMSSTAMQAAHSHDGLPHYPRLSHPRKASTEIRSRTTSTSSRRTLDPGPASPSVSSPTPSFSSSLTRPQDRPHWTFKILHPESNFVLRVSRDITLDALRIAVERKFAMSGSIRLGADKGEVAWTLAHALARSSGASAGEGGAVERIGDEGEFQSLLERTAHLEKISLRIVD